MKSKLFSIISCGITTLGLIGSSHAALVSTDLLYHWDASDDGTATTTTWTSKAGAGDNDPTSNSVWTAAATGVSRVSVSNTSTNFTNAYSFTGWIDGGAAGIAKREDFQSGNSGIVSNTAGFEFWIKPDSLTGGNQVIFETGGTGRGFSLNLANDTLKVIASTGSVDSAPDLSISKVLSSQDINDFIQVVINISPGSFDLYVNPASAGAAGAIAGTGSAGDNNPFGTSNSTLGGIGDAGSNEFGGGGNATPWLRSEFAGYEGQIANVRLYTGGLTTDEIADNYASTVIPEPSAMLLGAIGVLTCLRRRRN